VKAYFADERVGRFTREGIQFAVELGWAQENDPAELLGAEAGVVQVFEDVNKEELLVRLEKLLITILQEVRGVTNIRSLFLDFL
jgi:hypothetical protein